MRSTTRATRGVSRFAQHGRHEVIGGMIRLNRNDISDNDEATISKNTGSESDYDDGEIQERTGIGHIVIDVIACKTAAASRFA